MSKVKLKPGDYVATKGMTEAEYHAVAAKFIESGAGEGEYPAFRYAKGGYLQGFGWHISDNELYHGDFISGDGYWAITHGCRQLTIEQVLGAGEPEADAITALHEAREAYREALVRVRRELGDGYTLVENAPLDLPDDMSDPANWQAGDVLECVNSPLPCSWLTDGRLYTVKGRDSHDWPRIIDDDGDEMFLSPRFFRFHHRPTK